MHRYTQTFTCRWSIVSFCVFSDLGVSALVRRGEGEGEGLGLGGGGRVGGGGAGGGGGGGRWEGVYRRNRSVTEEDRGPFSFMCHGFLKYW